jgi:hypothetical protein
MASAKTSALSLSSKYIFFKNVAALKPVSRHRAGTASPPLVRFNTAMIWLSVKLAFLMQNFLLGVRISPLDPEDFGAGLADPL